MHPEKRKGVRVLLLSNKVPYPANDGSSIAMASMADAYLKNGAEVCILCLNTQKHFKEPAQAQKLKPAGAELHIIDADTGITAVGAARNLVEGSPYHVSRFWQAGYEDKLRQLIAEKNFDLIQIEGLSMAVYLQLIKSLTGVRVVLRAHNVEYRIWQRHIANEQDYFRKSYLRIQVKRLRKFERNILRQVDGVIAITDEDRQCLQEMAPATEMITIPCGIDLENFEACSNPHPKFDLVYLASFDWLPNTQGAGWFLEKVWPLLVKQSPGISFALGGRSMPQAWKKMELPGLKLFPDVADMREFVCNGKIVVVPLLAGSGMRIKMLENMALGKCQVSTAIGAEGIDFTEGHEIAIADTPEAMADKILHYLKEDEQRLQMGRRARQKVEEAYGNRRLGARLLEFDKTRL